MLFNKREKKNKSSQFIVACQGWSGSHWLAHRLNENSEIVCSHGPRSILSNDEKLYNELDQKKLTRERYFGFKDKMKKSIDEVYSEILQSEKAMYYGSVHLYQLRNLALLKNQNRLDLNEYNIINLVRHPLDFAWSGYGHLNELFAFDLWVLHGTISLFFKGHEEFVFDMTEKYDLDITNPDTMAFFGGCANILNLGADVHSGLDEVKYFRMEDITTQTNAFEALLLEICPEIQDSKDYAEKVTSSSSMNNHNRKIRLSTEEKYRSLNDWQKEVYNYYLKESCIHDRYISIGYKFEFND